MPTEPPTAVPRVMPSGRSIVAGQSGTPPTAGDEFSAVDPTTGRLLATVFHSASPEDVESAAWQAWTAFYELGDRSGADRAALLDAIATNITDLGQDLLATAADETGLGAARLVSERERTVTTLRMFGALAKKGEWVRASIDTGQPSRRPTPRPDLRRMLRPLGPVAVFGAGNFPLAYSTAGGDGASALAAGCPVIVKGHPGHPGTGELVAQAVARAVAQCGFHPGTFSFLHGGGAREAAIGRELVTHQCVRAVGFTGSLSGGMALARLGAERPDPIPVFAEMGSTNPVFVLPGALEAQLGAIAERLAGSATIANGQMCTCPGLLFTVRGAAAETLIQAVSDFFNKAIPQAMLNARTRANFARRAGEVAGVSGVDIRGGSPMAAHATPEHAGRPEVGRPIRASPALFRTTFEVFMRTPSLHDEVFGPAMIVVVCDDAEQLVEAAAAVRGSLTGSIWAGAADGNLARRVQAVLEMRVGRLIFNGVPTGVEVSASMVHGGPYPATNQAHATAVGPLAIERWCRPVCYQNVPDGFLPAELRSSNPLGIRRLLDGEWQSP